MCTYMHIYCLHGCSGRAYSCNSYKRKRERERTRLDYSNLFWIFERNGEQENAGQRSDGRGCHFGFT